MKIVTFPTIGLTPPPKKAGNKPLFLLTKEDL